MDIGAEIHKYGTACAERHELSVKVRAGIQAIYSCRTELERARRTGQGLGEALDALRRAREAHLAVQRDYDDHLKRHQCMSGRKAAAAGA